MKISQRSIEDVREATNIVEAASEFTALRRQGASFAGLCPYPDHQEKTPSFSVTPDKGFYHCFGCGRGGDSIKLVMELKSLPFAEAVSYLADRSGVELEMEGRSPEQERAARKRTSRRRSAHKALAAATAYYHKYLLRSPAAEEARRYLRDRGFQDSTIEEFRLGYAPGGNGSGFVRVSRKVGLGHEALEAAGLLSGRGGDRFFDRITFPISDPRGRIVGFGARALGEAKPKYLNSPETELFNKRALLYGFPQVAAAVRREGSVLVVEGYTDVLMLYQSGIQNAVATLGTAMTEQHLKALSGYADRIFMLFDPDTAGEKAVEKAENVAKLSFKAMKRDAFLYVVRLPKDPADWLLEHPASEFSGFLTDADSIMEYIIRSWAKQARGKDALTRHLAMPRILEYVREIGAEAPTLESEAKRLAADALQVSAVRLETLLAAHGPKSDDRRNVRISEPYGSYRHVSSPGGSDQGPETAPGDPLVEAGREFLALAVARPDLVVSPLRDGVGAPALTEPLVLDTDDFGHEVHARIFALLRERAVEHSAGDSVPILSDERARPLLDALASLQAAGEALYPSDAAVRAAWLRVGALSRERAKSQTDDLDEKFRIHGEIKRLNRAAVQVGNLTLES